MAPEIDLNGLYNFEANSEMKATCISRDGRPASQIVWMLNDEMVGPGEVSTLESFDSSNSSIFTSNIHF